MIEIHKVLDDNGIPDYFVWDAVAETYVESFDTYDEARSHIRFLKRGGGFGEFTPAFMGKKITVKGHHVEVE